MIDLNPVLAEIAKEYHSARVQHPTPMRGAHEGYGVLLEEVDELWDEVKAKRHDKGKMRKECIQIAAMAVAFIEEVCDGKG
jgi:hypothetical protein